MVCMIIISLRKENDRIWFLFHCVPLILALYVFLHSLTFGLEKAEGGITQCFIPQPPSLWFSPPLLGTRATLQCPNFALKRHCAHFWVLPLSHQISISIATGIITIRLNYAVSVSCCHYYLACAYAPWLFEGKNLPLQRCFRETIRRSISTEKINQPVASPQSRTYSHICSQSSWGFVYKLNCSTVRQLYVSKSLLKCKANSWKGK